MLGLPAAEINLAFRGTELGIVSAGVSAGRDLVLGNVVLSERDPNYPADEHHGIDTYTLEAIFEALLALDADPPPRSPTGSDACSVFAGYLMLDALIGNTDRHHENWGVLVASSPARPMLAPTFDHASSMGFLLSYDERTERVTSADQGRTVERYAERGRSRHFAGRPNLVHLAGQAVRESGGGLVWGNRLAALDDEAVRQIIDRIPANRMSHPSRMFGIRMLAENRRRLLDALDRAC